MFWTGHIGEPDETENRPMVGQVVAVGDLTPTGTGLALLSFVYVPGMSPRGGDAHFSLGFLPSIQTGLRPVLATQGQR